VLLRNTPDGRLGAVPGRILSFDACTTRADGETSSESVTPPRSPTAVGATTPPSARGMSRVASLNADLHHQRQRSNSRNGGGDFPATPMTTSTPNSAAANASTAAADASQPSGSPAAPHGEHPPTGHPHSTGSFPLVAGIPDADMNRPQNPPPPLPPTTNPPQRLAALQLAAQLRTPATTTTAATTQQQQQQQPATDDDDAGAASSGAAATAGGGAVAANGGCRRKSSRGGPPGALDAADMSVAAQRAERKKTRGGGADSNAGTCMTRVSTNEASGNDAV